MSKDASSTLPSDVSALQSLLLAERRQSQQRVTSLEADLAQTKSQLATKDLELQLQAESHRQKQERLEQRIAELLKQMFAKRRERFIHPDQLMLFDLDERVRPANRAASKLSLGRILFAAHQ